jgi:hypothetical protein
MLSRHISIASSAAFPFPPSGPDCAMPNPILIGSAANAELIGIAREAARALMVINA